MQAEYNALLKITHGRLLLFLLVQV